MKNIISELKIENSLMFKGQEVVVSSLEIAKVFGKLHKNVLKLIKTKEDSLRESLTDVLVAKSGNSHGSDCSRENIEKKVKSSIKKLFIKGDYINSRGQTQPRYFLTRKGFDFIALSFSGKKADIYKYWYIEAFHNKHQVIVKNKLTSQLNHKDDAWTRFRDEGKIHRKNLTKTIQERIANYRIAEEGKANDGRYYIHYANLINRHLNIPTPKAGVDIRDTLDKRQLVRLEDTEEAVAEMINKYADEGKHYKEVFKIIKAKLEAYKPLQA